jgi:adenosylmethionine-8-amino-7-oxononanoate aminotransferase
VGALDHLWLHFTEMGRYEADEEIQVIVRGDGCYLEDSAGRRYLDGLAGLFCVNIGYGFGEEMGEAAAAQMRELPLIAGTLGTVLEEAGRRMQVSA